MRYILIFVSLLASASPAFALQQQPDTSRQEISGSSASSLSVTDTFAAPDFSLAAGYSYRLNHDWQLSAGLSFEAGTGFSSLAASFGPTINFFTFENTLSSAFYLRPFIGASYVSDGSPRYVGSFGGAVGKRFEITKDVVWKPELALRDFPAFGEARITFNLFQLAVLLN